MSFRLNSQILVLPKSVEVLVAFLEQQSFQSAVTCKSSKRRFFFKDLHPIAVKS